MWDKIAFLYKIYSGSNCNDRVCTRHQDSPKNLSMFTEILIYWIYLSGGSRLCLYYNTKVNRCHRVLLLDKTKSKSIDKWNHIYNNKKIVFSRSLWLKLLIHVLINRTSNNRTTSCYFWFTNLLIHINLKRKVNHNLPIINEAYSIKYI